MQFMDFKHVNNCLIDFMLLVNVMVSTWLIQIELYAQFAFVCINIFYYRRNELIP